MNEHGRETVVLVVPNCRARFGQLKLLHTYSGFCVARVSPVLYRPFVMLRPFTNRTAHMCELFVARLRRQIAAEAAAEL